MGYRTAFIVSKRYERLGLATIMRLHLESYMARNILGLGVYLLSHVEATSEHSRAAAYAIMRKVGASPVNSPDMQGWYIKLIAGESVPETPRALTIQHISLQRRSQGIHPPEGITYRKQGFYVEDSKIADLIKSQLTFIGESIHIEQMFELWQGAKQSGFSIGLNL